MKKLDFWKVFNEKHINLFAELNARWKDEKEYEDIKEYLECFKKNIKEDVEVYGILKSPFAIKVKCIDGNIKIKIKNGRFHAESIK